MCGICGGKYGISGGIHGIRGRHGFHYGTHAICGDRYGIHGGLHDNHIGICGILGGIHDTIFILRYVISMV